jgi:hypothetical protein
MWGGKILRRSRENPSLRGCSGASEGTPRRGRGGPTGGVGASVVVAAGWGRLACSRRAQWLEVLRELTFASPNGRVAGPYDVAAS